MSNVTYISYGRPRATRRAVFPGATPTRVAKAIESLRALWRTSKTTRKLDRIVYSQIKLATSYLKAGYTDQADDVVYDAVGLITQSWTK